MDNIPSDFQIAYEHFMLMCTKYNYSFAGMAIRVDTPAILAIGNATERGHDFAKLLRSYADLVDEKQSAGLVKDGSTESSSTVN